MNATILNHYFPLRLCLTTQSRPDRWEQAKKELTRVGVTADPFYAYPDQDRFQSFNRSQLGMMQEGVRQGMPALMLEDDVTFQESDHLQAALQELPIGWDILYLGANITEEKPARHSDHLFRIRSAWTTHAVAYSPFIMGIIAGKFQPATDGMFDDWISRNILPNFAAYIVAPMVCWQRPGKSELWDRLTDYEPAFINSNQKLI